MLTDPKQFCRHIGCGSLVDSGYCAEHASEAKRKRFASDSDNSTLRGYDRRWRTFRLHYLQDHPWCVDCLADTFVKVAEHIHHVRKLRDYPELKYDDGNLMALCRDHHNSRTAQGE